MTHTNPSLPEAGNPAQKLGKSLTVMQGATLRGKALPSYLMMKLDAKVPKVSSTFLLSIPQICAQLGFPKECYFDVPFTKNPKGGMNAGRSGNDRFT
jgi:hypothetical protein